MTIAAAATAGDLTTAEAASMPADAVLQRLGSRATGLSTTLERR